jgi:hypothetical protein
MQTMSIHSEQVTIRAAYPDDEAALRRLAQLDSAGLPADPVLVAEEEGEVRAALSLADGAFVADPFHPTEHLAVLLHVHGAQLAEPRWGAAQRRRTAARAATAVLRALAPRRRDTSPIPHAAHDARDAALAESPNAWLRAA